MYWVLSMTTRATPLSAVKTTQEVSSLRVLMASHCLGGVVSGSFAVLVPLQDLFSFVVDLCTVLSYSILTKLITDEFSY